MQAKNDIKISAIFSNVEKIKAHSELTKIELKVVDNIKYNPRIIIYDIRETDTRRDKK